MSAKERQTNVPLRLRTFRGLAALVGFLTLAVLLECSIVLFAMSLGLRDETPLQWSFKPFGTDWMGTITVSPLYHLVPISVIVALAPCWVYLTKHFNIRPKETERPRSRSRLGRTVMEFSAKLKLKYSRLRAPVRSTITLFSTFAILILTFSLLAYPQLIYQTLKSAYQSNDSLLDFIRGSGQTMASIGSVFSGIGSAMLSTTPGFRDFVVGVGSLTKPLTDLDNTGKYLVVQNTAAWISSAAILALGQFRQKYQRRKK